MEGMMKKKWDQTGSKNVNLRFGNKTSEMVALSFLKLHLASCTQFQR
jgi:hypothetical protein